MSERDREGDRRPGDPQRQPASHDKPFSGDQLRRAAGTAARIRTVWPCAGRRFTGAVSNREGYSRPLRVVRCFSDEIGDTTGCVCQVRLLRVLQERKVRPLGSSRDIEINVRLSPPPPHRDLPKAMAPRQFREDMFYRLNAVEPENTAALERTEDIRCWAAILQRRSADRHKPFVRAFSSDAMGSG